MIYCDRPDCIHSSNGICDQDNIDVIPAGPIPGIVRCISYEMHPDYNDPTRYYIGGKRKTGRW